MSVTISGSGQIIKQVVQTTNTSQSTVAAGANTEVFVTGMTASITPTNASNKIMVMLQFTGAGKDNTWKIYFKRNGTKIYYGTNPQANQQTASAGVTNAFDGNQVTSTIITYLDSPATTSTVTYDLYAIGDNAQTLYINRCQNNTAAITCGSYASSITLMEVAYA